MRENYGLQLLELGRDVGEFYPFGLVWKFLVVQNSTHFPYIRRPRAAIFTGYIEEDEFLAHGC